MDRQEVERVIKDHATVLRWLDGKHHDDNPHCNCWGCNPGTNGLEKTDDTRV